MKGKMVVTMAVLALLAPFGAVRAQQTTDAAQLYARNCASCHGANGAPNPVMARSLGAIPDFTDPRVVVALPDSVLINAVTAGKGRNMPAYRGRLTADQIRALVAHVRTLSRRS